MCTAFNSFVLTNRFHSYLESKGDKKKGKGKFVMGSRKGEVNAHKERQKKNEEYKKSGKNEGVPKRKKAKAK